MVEVSFDLLMLFYISLRVEPLVAVHDMVVCFELRFEAAEVKVIALGLMSSHLIHFLTLELTLRTVLVLCIIRLVPLTPLRLLNGRLAFSRLVLHVLLLLSSSV